MGVLESLKAASWSQLGRKEGRGTGDGKLNHGGEEGGGGGDIERLLLQGGERGAQAEGTYVAPTLAGNGANSAWAGFTYIGEGPPNLQPK